MKQFSMSNFQFPISNLVHGLARRMGSAVGLSVLLAGYYPAWAAESATSGENGPTARVITVHDPGATEAFRPRPARVQAMVNRAVTNLTGKATVAEAWRSLVPTQEVVGIKVYSVAGPNSGTRPAVVAAVVEGLLAAGLPPKRIIVWDKQTSDLRAAGFFDLAKRYGIRVAGSANAGYDEKTFYNPTDPLLGNLVWGDLEFGKKGPGVGRKSFVSKLLTREITKIINVSPLLNHNLAGVSGNLYSLATGGVDNLIRFEADPDRLATAVPEIYNLPALNDHVVLNIVDALICQYEGGERGLLHYSATLNQLRFSKDPVALDVLSLKDLERQREASDSPSVKPNIELYHNASLLELGVSDVKKIRVEELSIGGPGTESQIPNPKSQIPRKPQISSSKPGEKANGQ
jgi:hypothetical protein